MMRPKRRRQEVWQIKSVLKISLAEVAAVERIGEEWSGVEWSEVGADPRSGCGCVGVVRCG